MTKKPQRKKKSAFINRPARYSLGVGRGGDIRIVKNKEGDYIKFDSHVRIVHALVQALKDSEKNNGYLLDLKWE